MNYLKPSDAPPCWSKKYQDGDEECMQCRFKEECRSEMLYNISRNQPPPIRSYAPPIQTPPRLSLQAPTPPKQTTQWTVPSVPSFPSSQPTYQAPIAQKPIVTTTQTQAPTTYFQQTTGASVPHPAATPNPLSYWQRPGAVAQSYYFSQYPGESIGIRIVKNIVLRALEAIFAELMQFFRHWTWPSSSK